MKAYDVAEVLERLSPAKYACEWDNVGLNVGRTDRDINKILVTLDIDEAAVSKAIELEAEMIVSHHPLLFHGIKRISNNDITGRIILNMIENGINGYCMHTNFDCVGGMASEAASIIGLNDTEVLTEVFQGEGIGKIGNLSHDITVKELCEIVKKRFGLDRVVLYGNENNMVCRVAVCPGSGRDEIPAALERGAKAIITGDVTYHYGIEYSSRGINIIDAGHYGIEHIFIDKIADYLASEMPDITVVRMDINNPQKYI